ncbi:MAG: membrane protein insertase YidC [Actinomycetota bacterium]|nr:MAG: membrane protein insertase YidC [Actinomycetota bacterium]
MFILDWLRTGVSWILVQFHQVFGAIFGDSSGWAWVLSIVGLVVVIRILLIPLFVKQIKAQRNLQIIQPQMKAIQKKYAGDRERQSQEMMKLYRETGTNPLASCLPILLQAPIFFALFSVLQGIARGVPEGVFTWPQYADLLSQAQDANIFGVPIYGTFLNANETPYPTATRVLAMVLIVAMSATTFITQRQLIVKNTAPDNPMVKQQKILLYVFPLVFAVGGINFPIGVLVYWFTTNLWTMGQQFYVIRNNPVPGTPAAAAQEARRAAKAARKAARRGDAAPAAAEETAAVAAPPRQQPKRQSKSKRQAQQPKPAGAKAPTTGPATKTPTTKAPASKAPATKTPAAGPGASGSSTSDEPAAAGE